MLFRYSSSQQASKLVFDVFSLSLLQTSSWGATAVFDVSIIIFLLSVCILLHFLPTIELHFWLATYFISEFRIKIRGNYRNAITERIPFSQLAVPRIYVKMSDGMKRVIPMCALPKKRGRCSQTEAEDDWEWKMRKCTSVYRVAHKCKVAKLMFRKSKMEKK